MTSARKLFALSGILFALLWSQCVGQGARGNGRGRQQLDSVEPGGEKFRRRNTTRCDPEFRTYDGTCTNDVLRAAGSASTAHFSYFRTLTTTNPTGGDLESARMISNVVCPQSSNVFNRRGLSEFVTFFAQFLDHTIVAATAGSNHMNIPIPRSDPIFANFSGGVLPFERNQRAITIESLRRFRQSSLNTERPINILSSAIDLVSVYGANEERANALRTKRNGLMKTSAGNMLPLNTMGLFNAPASTSNFFLAGDHRANEHPVLTAFHTIFMREHNRLARDLKAVYPRWNDERLFQMARKINIAQFQKIVYEEFFPIMTGRQIRRYKTYRRNAIPAVSLEFSTAAYRIGHTMIGNHITRRGPGMRPMPDIPMGQMFFRDRTALNDGVEPFLRGSIFQKAQEIDTKVVDALRNFLFTNVPQEAGFDLIAFNLQRSRDHAVPKYNQLRRRFTSRAASSFADITSNVALQSKLMTAYGTVDNVEAWVGLMAEDHIAGGSMGQTMFALWTEEFARLRDGDRFFYQARRLFPDSLKADFPRLNEIYSESNTMEKVLLRNSAVTKREVGSSVWRA